MTPSYPTLLPFELFPKIIFGKATIIKWFSASRPFLSVVFDGFRVILPFGSMVSMAIDHWSNDVMVSMDRSPLLANKILAIRAN